ncbi:hypothetical protein M513_09739 [Trichuris suis]|uniref:Guanine nucleotide-binding protein-like 3 homolog n=1 Tax=Trichuris suis TaxID=68888 RepID=A0A085LWN0_9BILA|nr:hypothetical protein M513_09739 [Trichuris suis]
MAKMCLKKKSKRMTCRLRYKIQRKVREHNRKKRREQRKKEKAKSRGGGLGIKKLEHVPNSCPFKQELLEQAERSKREEERRKEILKAERRNKKSSQKSLEDLVGNAQSRQKHFDDLQQKSANDKIIESLSKPIEDYAVALRRVVKLSDIVLEILDARDPLGSRSPQVENMILDAGKRLVLVINKIDLIPKENIKKWLNYLRREYPAVAFKASTQEQRKKLGWISGANVITSKAIGADILMRLLAQRLGYPNVGKSSVINSLKRKIICDVGANPGVTRTVQEVQLDQKIRLIDSPGVIMAKDGSMDSTELALKNVIRMDKADCQLAAEAIFRRCSKQKLMLLYNLPDFNDVDEFLNLLAKSIGRLKKGGVPDRKMAARKVLQDWTRGKIRYYCEPPDDRDRIVCSEVVDRMMKEFDLDAISNEESLVLQSLPSRAIAEAVIMSDNASAQAGNAGEQLTKVDLSNKASETKGKKRLNDYDDIDGSLETEGNRQDNRFLKHVAKRRKRQMRKTENRCSRLADAMETAMKLADSQDDLAAYNFDDALEMTE